MLSIVNMYSTSVEVEVPGLFTLEANHLSAEWGLLVPPLGVEVDTTAGNTIIIACSARCPALCTATLIAGDDQNSYTELSIGTDTGSYSNPSIGLFVAPNIVGGRIRAGASGIAVNSNPIFAATVTLSFCLIELSGLGSVTVQDHNSLQQRLGGVGELALTLHDSLAEAVKTSAGTTAQSSIAAGYLSTALGDFFVATVAPGSGAYTLTETGASSGFSYRRFAAASDSQGNSRLDLFTTDFLVFPWSGGGPDIIPAWLLINEPATGWTDRSTYLHVGEGQHNFTLQLRQRAQATVDLHIPKGDGYNPTRGSQVRLYDQTEDGAWYPVFTGLLQDIEDQWRGNAGDRFITLTCVGMESVFDTVMATEAQRFQDQTCGSILIALFGRYETGCPVTLGQIDDGPILPQLVTNFEKLSDLFDQLATTAEFVWGVDPVTLQLFFTSASTIAAPWTFTESDLLWETANWKIDGQDYRNRQAIRLNYDAFPHSKEFFVGKNQTEITLLRPVQQVVAAWATLSTPNVAKGTFTSNPADGETVTIGPPSNAWQALHIYDTGGTIVDTNGNLQIVTTAGTSGATQPTWAAVTTEHTVDATVIWTNQGPPDLSTGLDVYRFKNVIDNTQWGQVLIGPDAATTCRNLVDAINANAATRGTTFSLPTWECAQCNAVALTGTTFTLQQKSAGTGYTASMSSSGAAFAWSSSTTSGGTSPQGSLGPHEGATISLQVYELGTSTAAPAVIYQAGSPIIHMATPLNAGSNLNVEYTRADGNVIQVEDTTQVRALAAITHGTGKYQQITDASSQGLISTSAAAGLQFAQQALAAYSVPPQTFTFETYRPGLLPGQTVTANIASPLGASSVLNGDWIVEEINAELVPVQSFVKGFGGHYRYTVRAHNIQQIASYLDFWEGLRGGGGGGGLGGIITGSEPGDSTASSAGTGSGTGTGTGTGTGVGTGTGTGTGFWITEELHGTIDAKNQNFYTTYIPQGTTTNGVLSPFIMWVNNAGQIIFRNEYTYTPGTNHFIITYPPEPSPDGISTRDYIWAMYIAGQKAQIPAIVTGTPPGAVPPPVSGITFTPGNGSVLPNANQTVTLTGPADTSIRYTLDGSTPTAGSQVYSGPIPIPIPLTIRAVTVSSAGVVSSVFTASYTIGSVTVPAAAGAAKLFWLLNDTSNPYTTNPTPDFITFANSHIHRITAFAGTFFDAQLTNFPNSTFYHDMNGLYTPADDAYIAANPSVVYRDGGGNPLFVNFTFNGQITQYLCNHGDPTFRARWIASATAAFASAPGYIGMFIDDVDLDMGAVYQSGAAGTPIDPNTGQPITTDQFQSNIVGHLENIRAAFPTKDIIHNAHFWEGGEDPTANPFLARQIAACNWVNCEQGFDIPAGTGFFSYESLLNWVDRMHTAGGAFIAEHYDTPIGNYFHLASFFLVFDSNDMFQVAAGGNPEAWEAINYIDLGNASGPRYTWNGLYRRDFDAGSAFVASPTGSGGGGDLGTTMLDPNGNAVTSIFLNPGQGMILQEQAFFVAPGGSDSGSGTFFDPFATLGRAQTAME